MTVASRLRWRALCDEDHVAGQEPPWRETPIANDIDLTDGPSELADLTRHGAPMLAHASLAGGLSQSYVVRGGSWRRVPRAALCGTQQPRRVGVGERVDDNRYLLLASPRYDIDWLTLAEASPILYLECAGRVLPPRVTIGALAWWLYATGAPRLRAFDPGNNVFGTLARWSDDPACYADRVQSALASMQYGVTSGVRIGDARVDMAFFLLRRAQMPACKSTYWCEISLAARRIANDVRWIQMALPVDTVAAYLTTT